MGNTIYASFSDPAHAEKAAGALLDRGVRPEDLSVVRGHDGNIETTNMGTTTTTTIPSADVRPSMAPSTGSTYDVENTPSVATPSGQPYNESATDLNAANAGYGDTAYRAGQVDHDNIDARSEHTDDAGDTEKAAKAGISTTTPADAGAGAITGTKWGLGLGAVAALASLIVPGVGLVVGGGALATALGGLAAATGAGAATGAVTGYLKDQGVDDHVASAYDSTVSSGGALLAISLPSGSVDEAEARSVLEKYGAGNVNGFAGKGYVA